MAGTRENVSTGFYVFRRFHGNIEFLLMHASGEQDLWTPPKGHVEPGESELETAFREVEEEAGLKANQLKVLEGFQKTMRYPVKGKPKRVEYWIAELLDPQTPIKISDEHVDYKWFTLEASKAYLQKFPNQIQAFEEAHEFIMSNN